MPDLKIRETLCEMGAEDSICLDGFDDAIIGLTTDMQVVYSYEKILEHLMKEDGMTDEEAADYVSYNTIRALPYIPDPKPIIVYDLVKNNPPAYGRDT